MGNLIFICGGVRSGKSAFALEYAELIGQKLNNPSYVYIASGVAFDEEMKQRIVRHQVDRESSLIKWNTIEIFAELSKEHLNFTNNNIVVWDCITTWLTNVLYKTEQFQMDRRMTEIEKFIEGFKECLLQWKTQEVNAIIVSNEVFDELSSKFHEVNLYREILGQLHQWIVSISDEAYEMDYSIYKRWK
ncbi:bifunctional adenosylcobinamide kinase/adenosylcobinamide-phosphate guanylyltransferase [Ureibacillus massiliensis]|uniref:bifunctional adenosylcobinamide kinase/adenosylcobinamide-phosphate guanylyltransferase n=1 Tax=Ureibacillus massiliensis TaxID=292806 RepID=UPI00068A2CCA|nr:bifunctional adenosylcobinamide kinase/adenosylcobinamide-phosphate guanylyltransferase [Ureibacillus massiliensis]